MRFVAPPPSAALALALVSCGTDDVQNRQQLAPIIGGHASADGAYPAAGFIWTMLAFGGQSQPVSGCTATAIAPDVILTAAHCVEGFAGLPLEPEFLFTNAAVAADVFSAPEPPFTVVGGARVRSTVKHPEFSAEDQAGLARANDIGLVFLDAPIDDIPPARLPRALDDPRLEVDARVTIVGYGQRTAESEGNASLGDTLKFQGDTRITEVGAYELRIGRTSSTAELIPQKCHGDSGGPTFVAEEGGPPVVVGVTSRAYDDQNCAVGGIDTRVDVYLDWITETVDRACTEGQRPGTAADPCPPVLAPDAGVVEDAAVDVPDSGGSTEADAGVTPDAAPGTPDASGAPQNPAPRLEEDGGCTAAGPVEPGLGLFLTWLAFAAWRRRGARKREAAR